MRIHAGGSIANVRLQARAGSALVEGRTTSQDVTPGGRTSPGEAGRRPERQDVTPRGGTPPRETAHHLEGGTSLFVGSFLGASAIRSGRDLRFHQPHGSTRARARPLRILSRVEPGRREILGTVERQLSIPAELP